MSSEQIEALLSIQARQADTADADLTLLTADEISRRVVMHDQTTTESFTDPSGAKHQVQWVRP
jgi:hypothetical protein